MTPPTEPYTLAELRHEYLRKVACDILGYRTKKDGTPTEVLSNADGSSKLSVAIAQGIADRMPQPLCTSLLDGQGMGSAFARLTCEFLQKAFARLAHLRPGNWQFSTSQVQPGIAQYDQYEHLAKLAEIATANPEIRAILGGDYFITPDIVVSRSPVPDDEINMNGEFVSSNPHLARYTPLRASHEPPPLPALHASISCKWTMRSDRAQNTRTEALNLIRNRKGKTPLIIVVTAEPLPRRLASIALGTGDVDCTYHAALHELLDTLESDAAAFEEPLAEVKDLISGRRLRDISDLPFDLSI